MFKYWVIITVFILGACSKNADQSQLNTLSGSAQALKNRSLAYVDSVDQSIHKAKTRTSMIYTLGDYSFFVTEYRVDGKTLLFAENGYSATDGTIQNKYYIRNDQVVVHYKKISDSRGPLSVTAFRTFCEKGKALFSDHKTASSDSAMQVLPYTVVDKAYTGIPSDVSRLTDAVLQRGSFDLRLEGITEYPKARYLVLSRSSFNAYRAALLIEKDDQLIRSISANPEKYRGRKLNLTWSVKSPTQAVYRSGRLAD